MRRLRWLGLGLMGLIAAGLGGVAWLMHTNAGASWLLGRVPGLEVRDPGGQLSGDFNAAALSLNLPGGDRIEIEGLRWRGLHWGLLQRELHAPSMQATRVRFVPSGAPSSGAPQSLALPVAVRIDALQVDEFIVGGTTLTALRAALQLGAPQHRLTLHGAQWQQVLAQGRVEIGTAAPLATQLQLQLRSDARLPWQAHVQASGPLAAMQATATLQAQGQSLTAQASLLPFAAFALGPARIEARSLDLAALLPDLPDLPATALSGSAELQPVALGLRLRAELANARAGRWDQQRLPVERLQLDALANPADLSSLRITELRADLPGGARLSAAGSVQDTAAWALTGQVQSLRPEALDGRLSPARLSGPLQLSGRQAGEPMSFKLDWRGELGARALPLSLLLQGELRQQGPTLTWLARQAEFRSGQARLSASGQGKQGPAGASAALKATLESFNPRDLWAGKPGSAWQTLHAGTRINADIALGLTQDPGQPWPRGQVDISLQPSQWGDAALSGRASYRRGPSGESEISATATLGTAEISTSATLSPGSGQARVRVKAPNLAWLESTLACWPTLGELPLRPGEDWLKGAIDSDFAVDFRRDERGQWMLGSAGQASGRIAVSARGANGGVQTRLTASLSKLRWSLPMGDAPVQVSLEGGQASFGSQTWQLQGLLEGPWSEHRLVLNASVALPRGLQLPPSHGGYPPARTASFQARLQGQMAHPLRGDLFTRPWDWRGKVQALQGSLNNLVAKPVTDDARPEALAARLQAFPLQLSRSTRGDWRMLAGAGRAEVGGAVLAWTDFEASLDAEARLGGRVGLRLEPLAIAPLLARWQPDFGWGGDLRIGGSASLSLGSEIEADVLLERLSGDLAVTDEAGTQALGLTDLRLAAGVHERVWRFSQGLAGRQLGSLAAAQTLRAQGRWPDAQTPIEGVLQAQVEQVSNWGAWAPAGWRLGGRLLASAHLGGRLGAPEWRGAASGEALSLRQPLLGVDVSEGRFALSLEGTRARLTQLEARGGEGWLRGSGEAELGESPTARLQLSADKLRVLARADRRLVASGQAEIQLGPQSLQLSGRVRADEGLIDFSRTDAPSLGDDVVVQRGPVLSAAAPTRAAHPRTTRVDLELDFGEAFRLVGRGLKTQLRGALKLTQRDTKLSLTGTLRPEGGQYAAYGQKLDVERGEVVFSGPWDNPALDLIAVRPNTDVRVGLRVGGSALSPRVALFSEPELPETDKLSWLLLGRGPDGLGRTDTALLQRAAVALLSGEGEGVAGRAIRGLGLDELSVAQADDDSRATIVRLGKQLSRRWYVGYERSLNATTGSWQLIYRIAQRFTLRAQSGDDNALDLIWQWRWD